MHKPLMRRLTPKLIAALLASFSVSAFCEQDHFGLDGVFVYREMIGGPYFDEWYVDGDLSTLKQLKLLREGKSGSLEFPIKVDCSSQKMTVAGAGLLWGHEPISADEIAGQINRKISESTVDTVCASNRN
ncbi:hypothetical protein [Microbulbifer aggregans]|uniref:hypothetical protein n=1 Tax=Microbulbifer aggregans TaxID=1769779 RepID=UPI001CFEB1A5|nr:hypothetical protein [Microbulbifer aggregans]